MVKKRREKICYRAKVLHVYKTIIQKNTCIYDINTYILIEKRTSEINIDVSQPDL